MFSSNTSQVSSAANYIEDVFSTYLIAGNSTARTITNGIDLSGKGGLVWIKNRSAAFPHVLYDTNRGALNYLTTTSTAAQSSYANSLTAFNSDGFSLGTVNDVNGNGWGYASWTFRKQAKFFDVVTWTGNGANRTIAHNLGSVPGCIMVKRTDTTGAWAVYHRSLANTDYLVLNTTAASATGATYWNSTTPTSTVFSLGTATDVNANGGTYVAYVFAHDAGGFGLAGTDNVISCGSCSTSRVELGWEPQWILIKEGTSTTGFWWIVDNMRGMALNTQNWLYPNASDAESSANYLNIDATGFTPSGFSPTNIYIAIRRGPMKTPTSGTSVFSPNAQNTSTTPLVTTNFPVDLTLGGDRAGSQKYAVDRLRGTTISASQYLMTSSTGAEATSGTGIAFDNNTGITDDFFVYSSTILWNFRRAPSFFDEVCYTGTGSNTTQAHNLGVIPELMIVRRRDTTGDWDTYSAALSNTEYLVVNTTAAKATGTDRWNSTTPTASVFSLGTSTTVNASGGTYVAYLFASTAGVSKVGSYSGTGATQTISCGFAARFVMIKRTDSTGDWWVWDTARGMVSGTDPRLQLNYVDAENNANWVYTDASGFQIVTTDATVNASGGSYLYLAIS